MEGCWTRGAEVGPSYFTDGVQEASVCHSFLGERHVHLHDLSHLPPANLAWRPPPRQHGGHGIDHGRRDVDMDPETWAKSTEMGPRRWLRRAISWS